MTLRTGDLLEAPPPIVEGSVDLPEIALLPPPPATLLILDLFRGFSLQTASSECFRLYSGIPLLAVYTGYTVVQYAVS